MIKTKDASMDGFNFNMQGSYDFNNQINPPQFNQPFNQNQNFGQAGNFDQGQNFNFWQNAEKLSQDLQSFYQPPKSEF